MPIAIGRGQIASQFDPLLHSLGELRALRGPLKTTEYTEKCRIKSPSLRREVEAGAGLGGRDHRDNARGTSEFTSEEIRFSTSTSTRFAVSPGVVGNCRCLRWHIGGQPIVFLGPTADANCYVPN